MDQYLIVKGSRTGLGDRVRAALVGFMYAEISHRSIYVDWRDGMYGPEGTNVFETFFKVNHVAHTQPPPDSTQDVAPAAWRGRLGKSMDCVYVEDGAPPWNRTEAVNTYSIDIGRLEYPDKYCVAWEFTQLEKLRPHLPPDVRGLPAEQIESWAWHRYLELSNEMIALVEKLITAEQGSTLGVHIRATKEFSKDKGEITLISYFEAIDRVLKKQSIGRIFVATDNSEILAEVQQKYFNAFAPPKWFAAPGDPIHLAGDCPDNLSMARDALLEVAMLARCDWLISIDNSSFSILDVRRAWR